MKASCKIHDLYIQFTIRQSRCQSLLFVKCVSASCTIQNFSIQLFSTTGTLYHCFHSTFGTYNHYSLSNVPLTFQLLDGLLLPVTAIKRVETPQCQNRKSENRDKQSIERREFRELGNKEENHYNTSHSETCLFFSIIPLLSRPYRLSFQVALII